MIKQLFVLTGLLLTLAAAQAQLPGNIEVKGKLNLRTLGPRAACPNNAGTLRFGPFNGQSNSVTSKQVFLCFNDTLRVIHNNDFNLGGDPDPFSPAGIRYAFYDCPPTISGPTLSDILRDSCLNKTSPIIVNGQPVNQTGGIWITTDGTPGGNISLFNSGQFQTAYAGGNPVAFWFAPITVDDFANRAYEPDRTTGEAGPCVNVNTNAAFQVIYLNAITAGNITTNLNGQTCQGSFIVRGGLPEYDTTTQYSISIRLVGNTAIQGRILGPARPGHLDTIRFFVPQAGTYEVLVEDGKSCEALFTVNMSGCDAVSFRLPFLNALPGDTVCVPLRVSNFRNVGALEMSFSWDSTVVDLLRVQNFNPQMNGFGPGSISENNGRLFLSWLDPNFAGVTLSDSSALFELCFRIVGNIGQNSPLRISPSIIPEETVGSAVPSPIGYILNNGQINVSANVLFLSLSQDSVQCEGGSTGAFTITVANGVPPYNISWQSLPPLPADSGTGSIPASGGSLRISNKPAGRYRVQVRDSQTPAFNSASDTVEILQPPLLAVRLDERDPSCFGRSDGSIRAVILIDAVPQTNPGPEYTFRWSVPGITGDLLDSIPGGSYSVTVTNAAGCTSSASTNLSPPAPIILSPAISNATCTGVANGRIVLNASGGFIGTTGRYTFNWQGLPQTTGTASTITGLLPGSYCVTVTDDNGCTMERCFVVGAAKILAIDPVVTNASCNGLCDAQIIANGSSQGGQQALPFVFSWSANVPGAPITTQASSTVRNLCAGTYIVNMRDSDPVGCQVTDTIVVTEPEPLDVALVELVNETCVVGNDGRVTVSASGGTGPYQYFWSNGQTDSVAVNLSAGVYDLRVVDANDCENSLFQATIIAPTPPQITSLENDTLNCSTDTNGSLSVAVTPGGAAVVTIEWSNGVVGNSINNLSPGAYSVLILAADGCRTLDTALVVAPDPIRLDSVTFQAPRCPGEANGQATLNISGGTRPYRYIWATPSRNDTTFFPLRPGLSQGVYAFTVTDANNCPGVSDSVRIQDPPRIQVAYTDTTSVSCFAAICDGAITATGRYSNGASGRFTFSWSSGETTSGAASSRAVQLCAGPNALVVVDSNACAFVDTVRIPSPPEILIDFTAEPVSCNGGQDGQISAQVSGGTPGYTYLWVQNSAGTPTIDNLRAGVFTVRITDANRCPKEASFTLTEPDPLVMTIDPAGTNNVRCNGGNDGRITVSINTGDNINPLGPNPFTWSDGTTPANSPSARQLAAGNYSITVTDSKGCQDTLSYEILEPEPIVAIIQTPEEPRCFGESTTIMLDTVYGGNGASFLDYVFSINNSGISFPPTQAATIFAGEIIVTIEDPLGCTFIDTLFVNQPDELKVFFDPAEIVVGLGDSTVILEPIITASLPIDVYAWSPADFLSASNVENPRIVSLLDDQLFTLSITDINGCAAEGSIFVELDRNRNVYLPNVFSPNGDGQNDEFRVFACNGVSQVRFAQVFDRWGGLVWESRSVSPDCLSGAPLWDGKIRGKDAPAGVYVYLVEVEFLDRVVLLYRGDVTLIR